MAKDPAFLFYPNDFDCATRFFTNEQIGIYLRLLIAQFQNGRLSEKHINIICKSYDEDVMSKFLKDGNGLFYNERLENEIIKRKNYSESRRKNRKNKENISLTYDNHMENENIDINNSIINNKLPKEIKDSNSWANEKNYFLNDEQFQYKIATSYSISNKDVINFANVFLKELDLAEDYKDSKELKRHFSYWIKKRKDENEKKSKYQQTDLPKVQTLRKLPNSPTPRYD